jgi:hypothetical protein
VTACRTLRGATSAELLACFLLIVSAGAAAAAQTAENGQEPDGVSHNAADDTYTVHRVPKRSLDAIMKSIAGWQHQVLADGSAADYLAEDGILSMKCGTTCRPSAIAIATIDLNSIAAYEAGVWHIGIRTKDGTRFFSGVLRGEVGPPPHNPDRVSEDRRVALGALVDLYDLAYLAQNQTASAATGSKAPAPAAVEKGKPPAPTPLETLAASGDVEVLQAQRAKANSREVSSALEKAYGVRARSQMLGGQVDSALETLGAGRQKFGKSAELRTREANYVVIGDAYDRLRLAVHLDVGELRRYLQQIRALEPADAATIEKMLAQTLSNRIADQRAAGRDTVAEDLATYGRDLFPAWAALLTRGAAGALPQSGVEIGTTAGPHN